MITVVLILAAVGLFVTVRASYRVLVAVMAFCDWFDRGQNPFGIPIDESIQLRIMAGTLAPDGKRWTTAALNAKEAQEAALEAGLRTCAGSLWDVEPPLAIGTIVRLEAERGLSRPNQERQ